MNINKRFYDLASHLWRGGKYSYFWTPDDSGEKITYWLTVNGDVDVPKMFNGKDTYFSVHPSIIRRSEHERARIEDIAAINGFYCEFDCETDEDRRKARKVIDSWPIKPAAVVDSGGGYHVYILLTVSVILDTDEKRKRAIDLQWAFSQWAGGDTSVNDLARVLRVPGTYNHKPKYGDDKPLVSIVDFDLSRQYDIADIEPLLQPIIDQREARQAHSIPPLPRYSGSVTPTDDKLFDVLYSSKNGAIYERLARADYSDVGGDPSAGDQLFCDGLAWVTGGDVSRMDSMFRGTSLMRDKWLRDDYRLATLENAANSAQMFYDPFSKSDPDAMKAVEDLTSGNMVDSSKRAIPPIDNTQKQSGNGLTIAQQLMSFGADDEGNARSVHLLYGDQFLYCDAYGYLHYNGKYWETAGAEAALRRAIIFTLQQRRILAVVNNQEDIVKESKQTASRVKACIYLVESLITVNIDVFDANPEMLNCNNGVVNLRTGELYGHDSKQRFTYAVPVDYDPTADYVDWVEFLTKITSGPEMLEYLKYAVGYTATGLTQEECLFYIHGPSRSGKGTFVETILSVLPKPIGVQADFSTFTAKREGDMQNFDLAPLKPSRFVAASESSKYDTLNEAKIKSATGGDWIRCAFKHRDHFEYRPQFKIWLVSNHPIKGDVDDDAFWGRVRVIEFPHSFLGKEDKNLKRRMKKNSNLRGVLRWMVEGAMAWFASPNGLNSPQVVIDATSARRLDLDYIQQWLDECCKVDSTAWTSNSDLRASYESWCKAEGQNPKGAVQFSWALSKKGYKVGVKKVNPFGKQARGVEGLSVI